MIVEINRPTGEVTIDGETRTVSLHLTSNKLLTFEWDGETGVETWIDGSTTTLDKLDKYLHIVDAWHRVENPYYGMDAAEAERLIRQNYDAELAALGRPYLENEQKSWTVQEQEARAYLADIATSVPYITAMAAARGITVDILASKIIENADLFRAESARILGEQQREIDLLNS